MQWNFFVLFDEPLVLDHRSEKRTTSVQRTDNLPPINIDFTIEYISKFREVDTSQLLTTDTDDVP